DRRAAPPAHARAACPRRAASRRPPPSLHAPPCRAVHVASRASRGSSRAPRAAGYSRRMEADRATIWPYDDRGEPGPFFYSRYAHPTGAAAEQRLGALEGGDALLYSSGMGAATTIILAFARPGTTIALAEGAYYGTSVLMRDLARWDLELAEYDQTGTPPAADMVWVEAPANPVLTVPDWDSLRAH